MAKFTATKKVDIIGMRFALTTGLKASQRYCIFPGESYDLPEANAHVQSLVGNGYLEVAPAAPASPAV